MLIVLDVRVKLLYHLGIHLLSVISMTTVRGPHP